MAMSTIITTELGLKRETTPLHDGRFSLEDVDHDGTNQTFSLKCWTPEIDQRGRATSTWKANWLHFKHVSACKINVTEKVEYYELSRITYRQEQQVVELQTHYAVTISLTVDRLSKPAPRLERLRGAAQQSN
jgi:hypothetical protein